MESRKRKRTVLTIEEKLKIIELYEKKRSLASVAAEFVVGKSIVHDIVRSQEKLKTFYVEVQDYECFKAKNCQKGRL